MSTVLVLIENPAGRGTGRNYNYFKFCNKFKRTIVIKFGMGSGPAKFHVYRAEM